MNESWLHEACELLRTEAAIVRVSIARVRGSSPREPGATMLVSLHAATGTIGGGNLEWQAIELARRLLAEGDAPLLRLEQRRLGPDLAQCCGGEVWLELERMPATARPELAARREAWQPAPKPALWIFGAGHVGSAVVRLLQDLPLFDILWMDGRDGLPPPAPAAHVSACHAPEPVELIAAAAPGTAFLVFTHDHELDYQLCAAILARGDAAWTGLIGSQSKAARFRSRLRRAGFDERAVAALTCPVGITAIRSKLPAAIAVGIVAELLTLATAQALAGAPVQLAPAGAAALACDPDCRRCRADTRAVESPA